MQTMFESGYAIDEDVLSRGECERLLNVLSSPSVCRGRAGSRHLMSQPEVRKVASDPRLLRMASLALGADALPYRATLFEKSADANWLIVWHQDTALPLESQFDMQGWGRWSRKAGVLYSHAPAWALSHIVALRVHLDASTIDNGPLRVLPGSHTSGVMTDAAVFALARSREHVECVLGQGGVMTMYPLLVHASGKTRCAAPPRRVLHIEYADSLDLAPGVRLAVA
jgi:ectoine hydroxylase-related dioxygenase (phytanoyl-CoA dioxygenase family)